MKQYRAKKCMATSVAQLIKECHLKVWKSSRQAVALLLLQIGIIPIFSEKKS